VTKSSQTSHLLYIYVATGREIVTQNIHLLERIISNVTYIIYYVAKGRTIVTLKKDSCDYKVFTVTDTD
jgi:L-asparaginase II